MSKSKLQVFRSHSVENTSEDIAQVFCRKKGESMHPGEKVC